MTRLALVFGTRPCAIKCGPVVGALRDASADFRIIATGQHTDLLVGSPAESDLVGAVSLTLPTTDHPRRWVDAAVPVLGRMFARLGASHVAVQGDTMSALAAARAAWASDLPLAHIEAGVRSSNVHEPWPEELTRIEIDGLAGLHLAATADAAWNLELEGHAATTHVTGNTVVSAIARYSAIKLRDTNYSYVRVEATPPTILITLHRRELRLRDDCGTIFEALYDAVAKNPNIDFIWPVHPGMRAVLTLRHPPDNLWLVAPLAYRECLELLAGCRGVLTDSGGLVEEAACLGVPTAILRNVNDRPEAETAGVAKRVNVDVAGVSQAVKMLAERHLPRRPTQVFGTAEAASNVAGMLRSWMLPRH